MTTKMAMATTAKASPRAVRVCTELPSARACFSVKGAYFVAYWSAPSTSMGATLMHATQVIQPVVKLAKEPNEMWGKRTTPPDSGNMVPSSA